MSNRFWTRCLRNLSAIKGLNFALEFDGQRLTLSVARFPDRHAHPAFADAVFLHVMALFVVEANADVAREHVGMMMRTFRVGRQMIGQRRIDGRVGHSGCVMGDGLEV